MKQMKVFIYIFVTAFILSSCSIQKRCQAPELNLPDEIIAGENDTLTIADMSWWELYSDSTLSNLIKKTLRNNRNMQAAEAHIRQMEELYRVSKASRCRLSELNFSPITKPMIITVKSLKKAPNLVLKPH